jgi:hypothetical protein
MPNEDVLMLNRSTLNEALRMKPGCLTPEELEKFVENPATGNSHLSSCSRCQAELALLKSFESSEPLPDEGAAVTWISARLERQLDEIKNPGQTRDSSQGVSWFSRILAKGSIRWLLPLSAILVIGLGVFVVSRKSQEPDLRADAGHGPAIYRSEEIEVSSPVGEVAKAPAILQWKSFEGSAEYKVSIMEVDEVPLWTGQTNDVILTIPNAIRAKMLPGKPVLWRVTALDSQGRVLATSQIQRFSVQRKSSGSTSGVLTQ